jgi:hypothetical protein
MIKQLRGILYFLTTMKILLIVGSLFAIVFMGKIDNGKIVNIASPFYELNNELSENISSDLINYLNITEETRKVQLKVDQVGIRIPVSASFKVLIIFTTLAIVGYMYFGLHIIEGLIKDISNQKIFTLMNIHRVKRIGIMVVLAPAFELVIQTIFETWFSSKIHIQGLRIHSEDALGYPFYVIGALIYALGYVFQQGIKLQQENELTV